MLSIGSDKARVFCKSIIAILSSLNTFRRKQDAAYVEAFFHVAIKIFEIFNRNFLSLNYAINLKPFPIH